MPKSTLPRTVRHGSRPGCWNTIARSGPGFVISRPSSVRLPALIGCSPSTALRNVVLPQPDGPTMATNSPGRTVRSTPWTAVKIECERLSQYSMTTPFAASFAERSSTALAQLPVGRMRLIPEQVPELLLRFAFGLRARRVHRRGVGPPLQRAGRVDDRPRAVALAVARGAPVERTAPLPPDEFHGI